MAINKIFSLATLTLLVALTLSGIAAWYSIQGLMAIFAAAIIPIAIMGGALEVAKITTTVWLHQYWDKASWKLKFYLVPAVIALAFLTSMGIFGFLSKAHSDQTLVSGEVSAKVELIDEQIKIAREGIDLNKLTLRQMNAQVDQLLGRTTDDRGANRAVQVRRQQSRERARLTSEIEQYQATITKLNKEAAPVRAEIRKVEAEVGPIKYIAALIYGDNPDSNLLERAVRWVIILIVFVFDPLALALVIAAQASYSWIDEESEIEKSVEPSDKFVEVFKESKGVLSDFPCAELGDMYCSHEHICNADPYNEPHEVNAITPITDSQDTEDNTNLLSELKEEQIVEKPITDSSDTLEISDGGYVNVSGKSMSIDALKESHPQLFLQADRTRPSNSSFGTKFPKLAKKGDIFVRVDVLPNRVFKFIGDKWIEINKNASDTYLFDEEYVKYLISKLDSGEYDIELLTENEKTQIEEYLTKNK